MMNFIGEMAKAEQTDLKNLQKQLDRHIDPLTYMVGALIKQIQYMKDLIPQHIVNPLIEQVREMVNTMLDNLKNPEK